MSSRPDLGIPASDYDGALHKIRSVIREGIGLDEMNQVYDDWAETHDQDVALTDRSAPEFIIKLMRNYVTPESNPLILDLGAGTGLVGEELVKNSYHNVDALDGNQPMLRVAERKKIYRQLICAFVLPDEELPIPPNTYDVIICIGALYDGHITINCLPEIIRIVKKDGYIFIARAKASDQKLLVDALKKLEDRRMIKIEKADLDLAYHRPGTGDYFILRKI